MLQRTFHKKLSRKQKVRLVAITLLTAFVLTAFAFSPADRKAWNAYREDAVLLHLVQACGADFESINVTGWVEVEPDRTGNSDPAVPALQVAALLNLQDSSLQMARWQNPYARGVKLAGRTPDGQMFTVLGQALEPAPGKEVSHVMVSTAVADKGKARACRQLLDDALRSCGDNSHVSLTYTGKIGKEMGSEELLATAETIMARAGAPIQERTVKDNLVSLTGFSPRFFEDMRYDGREVNVNVALRSSPVDHATFVYVASPVILVEY